MMFAPIGHRKTSGTVIEATPVAPPIEEPPMAEELA
jgi:hypothetical protein